MSIMSAKAKTEELLKSESLPYKFIFTRSPRILLRSSSARFEDIMAGITIQLHERSSLPNEES